MMRSAPLLPGQEHARAEGSHQGEASVVSHKRLELFSLVFPHPRLSAAGLDRLQRLFAAL
jgi:hypothetical protein